MNNKNNSKIEKNNRERSKKNKTKKTGGAFSSLDRKITDTELTQGTQIYYTNEYNFVIDLLKKNKIDLTLKHKPKEITIEKIKEKIKENSKPYFFHRFLDHRLILMIQNTTTNKIELQKFYDDLIETLKNLKHRIYIFLPFYCGYNINHPTNTHSVNKKKLVNLSITNSKLYFFDIDKIYSLQVKQPGALVFGRLDSYYNQKCENLSKIGEDILLDLFKKIKEDNVENIKTKPEHYDYINKIDMPQQNHLGTQYQISTNNQQQNSQSNLGGLYLNMYGVDKKQDWPIIQQLHLNKLSRNGNPNENVLILGDSWSAGYYMDPYSGQKNSSHLAYYVSTYSDKNIYYPDKGAFGYTSKDLLNFLKNCNSNTSGSRNREILKHYLKNDVGIVVLFIGINDLANNILPVKKGENIKNIKILLKEFNDKIKILVVEYPKNLSPHHNQYSSILSSSMAVPMVNSVPISGYHKYGKEIAEGIKSLERDNKKESTINLTPLQPGDLSEDNLHLSTDSEISSLMYRRVGGKNNKKQKYEKYKTKEVLGKKRQIFRKKDSKSKKEYIIYKKEYILLKDYIKLKKSARK